MSPLLSVGTEGEYDRAVEYLNRLLDEVGSNEQHPLYAFLDTLRTLPHAYEEQYRPMPECNGAEVLQFLVQEHDLTQSDLPEVGSQGVILVEKVEVNTTWFVAV